MAGRVDDRLLPVFVLEDPHRPLHREAVVADQARQHQRVAKDVIGVPAEAVVLGVGEGPLALEAVALTELP